MTVTSNWFTPLHISRAQRGTILCFHFGGGNAMAFRDWKTHLPDGISLVGVDLPGRGMRFDEPLLQDLEAVIAGLMQARDWLCANAPVVFFGHSLGALVAYEYARALERSSSIVPAHLFVAGRGPLHLPRVKPPIHALSDADFIAAVREYDGTPEAALQDAELLQVFLPILRADFRISETYRWDPAVKPLSIPITAMDGNDDRTVDSGTLDEWGALTTGSFASRRFDGGHFFIQQHAAEIVRAMCNSLRRSNNAASAMAI